MNTCSRFKDYILGNMSDTDMTKFETHMAQCLHCAKEMERETVVMEALSAIPKVSPPHDFSKMVLKDLAVEENTKFAWRIYAASIVFIAVFVGLFADISYQTVLNNLRLATDLALDFGSSVFVAFNNISTILYNRLGSSSINSGMVASSIFLLAGLVFYKTVFAISAVKKR